MDEYTGLHEDGGGGDLDSLHLNVSGYNEVIFFEPNLTTDQKGFVFDYLNGHSCRSKEWKKNEYHHAMYCRQFLPPHNISKFYSKTFPTKDQLKLLKKEHKIGCDCFILKPGQLLFINAGRLHIFRKMGFTPLPESDPFHEKRKKYINDPSIKTNQKWNVSVAWDFSYIGYKIDRILPQAMLKWRNSIYAAQYNFGSEGCIETPVMVLLTRYGLTPLEKRSFGILKDIDVLLNALQPLFHEIIKYHGDKISYQCMMDCGEVIDTTTLDKYKGLKNEQELNLINFRCDSCKFHLSNHFLTSSSCLRGKGITVNICTSCFLLKRTRSLRTDIDLYCDKEEKENVEMIPKVEGGLCKTCFPIQNLTLNTFDDPDMRTEVLKKFTLERNFIRKVLYDDRYSTLLGTPSCVDCEGNCLRCKPKSECNCHESYKLLHLWANLSDIRKIYLFNRENSE